MACQAAGQAAAAAAGPLQSGALPQLCLRCVRSTEASAAGVRALGWLSCTRPFPFPARFHLSRWVQGPPHVRFYASAPLVSSDWGLRYGTL